MGTETVFALNLNLKLKPLTSELPSDLNVAKIVAEYGQARYDVPLSVYYGEASRAVREYVEEILLTIGLNHPRATIQEVSEMVKDGTLEVPEDLLNDPAKREALDILFSPSQSK